jgi:hypothetical protein
VSSPLWGSWPDICYSLTATFFDFLGRPLWREDGCLLYILLALASVVFLWSESLGISDHILLSQTWDFPFRRLLRLAGSRSRYSNSPPHRFRADRTENISCLSYCYVRNITPRRSHVTPTEWGYWLSDRRLATSYKHSYFYCCVGVSRFPWLNSSFMGQIRHIISRCGKLKSKVRSRMTDELEILGLKWSGPTCGAVPTFA